MNVCEMPILKSVKKINISYYGLCIVIVYAVYFSITAFLSLKLNVWTDEIYSLMTTSGGFNDTLHGAIYEELQAPLYFLILWCWRQINDSIFFLRLLSIIFGLAAIEVFRQEITRLVGRTYWVVLCVLLFLSSSVFIEYSVEIRRYTLVIFLSALSSSLFINYYLSSDVGLLARVSYLSISLIGIYCDYYFGFLLAGHFAMFIIASNRRNFKLYFIDMILFSIACAPLFYILNNQIEFVAEEIRKIEFYQHNVDLFFTALERYIIPFNNLIENRLLRWTARSILIVFAGVAIWKVRIWYQFKNVLLRNYILFLANLVVIFVVVVVNVSSSYFLSVRHFSVIYPIFFIFICGVLFEIGRKYRFALFVMIVMWVLFGITFCLSYKSFAKNGNYMAIAVYLNSNELPNHKIYVYPYTDFYGLRIYYRGINSIASLKEREVGFWKPQSEFIQTQDELKKIFMNIDKKENFRLVAFCNDNELYKRNCSLLDEYIKTLNNMKKIIIDDNRETFLYEKTN
jgi:hypothetical protein